MVVVCPACGHEADLAGVEVSPVTRVARWTCEACGQDVEVDLAGDDL